MSEASGVGRAAQQWDLSMEITTQDQSARADELSPFLYRLHLTLWLCFLLTFYALIHKSFTGIGRQSLSNAHVKVGITPLSQKERERHRGVKWLALGHCICCRVVLLCSETVIRNPVSSPPLQLKCRGWHCPVVFQQNKAAEAAVLTYKLKTRRRMSLEVTFIHHKTSKESEGPMKKTRRKSLVGHLWGVISIHLLPEPSHSKRLLLVKNCNFALVFHPSQTLLVVSKLLSNRACCRFLKKQRFSVHYCLSRNNKC